MLDFEAGDAADEILLSIDLAREDWRDGDYRSAMVLYARARAFAELQVARELHNLGTLAAFAIDRWVGDD